MDKRKHTSQHRSEYSVWKTAWWMKCFGGRTAKRHKAIGNTPKLAIIQSGKLKRRGEKSDTTKVYVDAKGKRRYSGTSTLKQTQQPGKHLSSLILFQMGRV